MRKTLLMTTGLAWLALTGAAGATVTLQAETALSPNYFVGQTVGSHDFMVGTDTWSLLSGTAGIANGTTAGFSADPLGDTLPYMSVEGGGTEQVVFGTARTSLSIYWGSIDGNQGGNDNLNSLAISVDGYTLTGADLVALGASGRGDEGSPAGNQLVTISGLGPFTTATFSSTNNAFEFSLGSAVPEPSTWAMMAIGFAGLGYAVVREERALTVGTADGVRRV